MNETKIAQLKDIKNYVMKSYEYLMDSFRESGKFYLLEDIQKEKDELEVEYDKQIEELERGA
jgi:hypothetical protein